MTFLKGLLYTVNKNITAAAAASYPTAFICVRRLRPQTSNPSM